MEIAKTWPQAPLGLTLAAPIRCGQSHGTMHASRQLRPSSTPRNRFNGLLLAPERVFLPEEQIMTVAMGNCLITRTFYLRLVALVLMLCGSHAEYMRRSPQRERHGH